MGAAHAGCFSMFLSALISKENLTPERIETTATVTLGDDEGPKITNINLSCQAKVPGLDKTKFDELCLTAKAKCPISRLFAGTDITLDAALMD